MEVNSTFGTFHQTNDQINMGDLTQRFAYFASVNGNGSDYGLGTSGPDLPHARVWRTGGFPTAFATWSERRMCWFTWVHTLSPGWLLTASQGHLEARSLKMSSK